MPYSWIQWEFLVRGDWISLGIAIFGGGWLDESVGFRQLGEIHVRPDSTTSLSSLESSVPSRGFVFLHSTPWLVRLSKRKKLCSSLVPSLILPFPWGEFWLLSRSCTYLFTILYYFVSSLKSLFLFIYSVLWFRWKIASWCSPLCVNLLAGVWKIDEAEIWVLLLFQWPRASSTRFGFFMGSSNREPVPALGFGSLLQIPDKIQNSLKVAFFLQKWGFFF